MKQGILSVIVLLLPLVGFAQSANEAYSAGQFNEAAVLYEQLIDSCGSNFELEYNVGNSYFKAGEFALAILHYERALRIKPGDRDARFNLRLTQTRIVDQIDPVPPFFLSKWMQALRETQSSNAWSVWSMAFFLVFLIGVSVYFLNRRRGLRKTGFYVALLTLFVSILSLVFARTQYLDLHNSTEAIIFTPTITIKSSPDQSGTDLFQLHEGTKVVVLSEMGAWREIETIDGNVGWIAAEHLVII